MMPTVSPPSRTERILRGAGYLCIGFAGIFVMLNAPVNLAPALGVIIWLWIAMMLTAIPCGISALLGRFRMEYALLPFFTGALVIANGNLWMRAAEDPDLGARAWTILALILTFAARWFTLKRLVRMGESLERRGHRWDKGRGTDVGTD